MTDLQISRRLSRSSSASSDGGIPAPPRIVHLGLGAFHRAHQAWYTAHSSDGHDWGIVGFTGRSGDIADRLSAQGGLYTLVERGPEGDRFEVVSSIVKAERGNDVWSFVNAISDPRTAILMITITEAGYRLAPDGTLNTADPEVQSDLELLREALAESTGGLRAAPVTALGRILLGLEARRRADGPPIAVVPCDNMPGNGRLVSDALALMARRTSPELAVWMAHAVSFVSTSVDRITPSSGPDDVADVLAATGWLDEAPVVTEPFSDWVLSGLFPSGRPDWESAGARFVDDLEPWESRKLWMLNGAHSLLASLGLLRGHSLVSQAAEDPVCHAAIEAWWDEASRHLPDVDAETYRRDLLSRFRNPRIEHTLGQISLDAKTKLRLRIAPVAVRERRAGRPAQASALALAAFFELQELPPSALEEEIGSIDSELAGDAQFVAAVRKAMGELQRYRSTSD